MDASVRFGKVRYRAVTAWRSYNSHTAALDGLSAPKAPSERTFFNHVRAGAKIRRAWPCRRRGHDECGGAAAARPRLSALGQSGGGGALVHGHPGCPVGSLRCAPSVGLDGSAAGALRGGAQAVELGA